MKITRTQLKQIIKESMDQYRPAKRRSYHHISPRANAMANAAKRSFAKDYPEIRVGIDAAGGWITVNGQKAVNISSADGLPNGIEDMVDQMKKSYLGHPQPGLSMKDTDRDGIADFADTDQDHDGKIDAVQGPRDIIHAKVGEVYEKAFLEKDFEVWLRKNPEYTRVFPGERNHGPWGTNTIDALNWYVDGPEEGPAWTLGSRDWSLDRKNESTEHMKEDTETSQMPASWQQILGNCLGDKE
jgi:hypothetical protein